MGAGGVNTVQIMCPHVCKCKNDTCGNCFRNGRKEDEGEWLKG
jgi:hypothetical protein